MALDCAGGGIVTGTVHDSINGVLNDLKPERVALVGADTRAVVDSWLRDNEETEVLEFLDAPTLMAQPAFTADWALVAGCLETLDDAAGNEFIGRLRNLITPRFCVLVENNDDVWNANRLAGFGIDRLGSEPLALDSGALVRAFRYDLATYKQKPDWLNADFWANPERFDKDFW